MLYVNHRTMNSKINSREAEVNKVFYNNLFNYYVLRFIHFFLSVIFILPIFANSPIKLSAPAGGSTLSYKFSSDGSNVIYMTDEEVEDVVLEPLDIPRPDEESVIAAIKRLTKTYPMVDKENILHPIADLMTSHMVQGRSAPDVIDDFEVLFKKEYEKGKQ